MCRIGFYEVSDSVVCCMQRNPNQRAEPAEEGISGEAAVEEEENYLDAKDLEDMRRPRQTPK